VAALMMATIPTFMALAEIILLGTRKFTARLAFALFTGLAGVAVLVNPASPFGGEPINWLGAGALLVSALSWSIGAALMRKLNLPPSKTMSASTQMLAGGVLLSVAALAFGEFRGFHPAAVSGHAWFALLYLIVAGSIMGFTAFLWLIHHESPTKVGTYAYVNPVVAVLLGYFLGGEALNWRTVFGALFVLSSVVLITTTPATPATVKSSVE
jgi:drug/metabolite transporter (DMT)-like permease